jgi:MFS family permease
LPNSPVDPASQPPLPSPTGRAQFFKVFPSVVLPIFLAVIDQTIVATALPAIVGDLGGVDRISWPVIAYLIAVTIAAPVYGRLGDVVGRRRLMFVALSVTIAASIGCALANSMEMLTMARVAQGFGGGGLMTLAQALIGEAIAPRDRARYQGYLAAVAVTSNTFGPVAGGFLTEHFGWRSVFLVNVPLGFIAVAAALQLAQRTGSGRRLRFDTIGLVLFAIFIASTILMLQRIQSLSADAVPVALLLAALATLAVVLFLRQERRAPDPLIPLALLREPSIWRCDVLSASHGAALVSLITFSPIYLRVVHGSSPAEIGLLMVPMTVGIGFGSLVTGRLVARTGYTAIFPACGLIGATLTIAALALWAPFLSRVEVAAALGLAALFMGTVMGVVQVTVQMAAGSGNLGTAAATVQFSRALGAALGTALVGAALFVSLRVMDPAASQKLAMILQSGPGTMNGGTLRLELGSAFRVGFLVIACFTAIGAIVAWTLPTRRI